MKTVNQQASLTKHNYEGYKLCSSSNTDLPYTSPIYTYLMLASVYLEVSIFNNIQILIKWTNFKTLQFELVFQIYFFQYFTSRVVNMGNQNLIVIKGLYFLAEGF